MTKRCGKCGGTGRYGVRGDPTCWRCGGSGVVKDETLVLTYARWIAQAATQDALDALQNNYIPHIKNAEVRNEITAMIEKVRPTLKTKARIEEEARLARRARFAKLREQEQAAR